MLYNSTSDSIEVAFGIADEIAIPTKGGPVGNPSLGRSERLFNQRCTLLRAPQWRAFARRSVQEMSAGLFGEGDVSEFLSDFDIQHLNPAQKLELITELWDSLPNSTESIPVPEWHRQELEQRLGVAELAEPLHGAHLTI